jgi:hypothetical protein
VDGGIVERLSSRWSTGGAGVAGHLDAVLALPEIGVRSVFGR